VIRLDWWMQVVGGFYLLLTAVNAYALLLNHDFFGRTLPPPVTEAATEVFVDAWMVFIFELAALGIALVCGASRPAQSRMLVIAVLLAEGLRGVVSDAIWIARGFSPVNYGAFIVVHIVIIVTGVVALRARSTQRLDLAAHAPR
jgi:hypothetical protein